MSEELIKCLKEKSKRDLFRVNGIKPTVINLEFVHMMSVEGNKIVFTFSRNAMGIDFETEEVALQVFEHLLKVWAGDVVE